MRVRLKQNHLLDLIARSNLTQNHWAMKLGLSRGHWSNLVNGKHPYPSARTRERLLEQFGVPFEQLFEIESGPSGWSDQDFQAAIADRYVIDREIGQGGMGTVYLARDVKIGRLVAIKVVSPEAVSGIGVAQFLREIRYTARLQHPHILPLYDADEAAGHPFYVTPYIREGSLRDRIKKVGQLSVDETLVLVRGIGAALQHAHSHHVLHCDVKPANVLVSGDHAYVADFGISRAVHTEAFEWGRRQQIDSSAGTPAYVSPEQASGEQNLDARSDVYSLGCMVFEMLVGHPPFVGDNTMHIVAQRFTSEVPDPRASAPHVPASVSTAVATAMELASQRRFQTTKDFIDALEAGPRTGGSQLRERLQLARSRLGAWRRRRLDVDTPVPRRRKTMQTILDWMRQDLVYAIRSLRRAPGFAAIVVATLAFGIAANTFVFSLMNPYFFRELPFGEPEHLVQLAQTHQTSGRDGFRFSVPMYEDYRAESEAFEDLAYYRYTYRNVTGTEGPERVMVSIMSANMFSVLQAQPAFGRTLLPDEDGPGAPRLAVLGHGLWRRRFGADSTIVGRSIAIDGVPHEVTGVMPELFTFPFGSVEMWVASRDDPAQIARDRTNSLIVGRLKPDWTRARAQQELEALQREYIAIYPEADGFYLGVTVTPIREALNFAYDILRIVFTLSLAAVTFALVIACVNVASLTLARASARTGEVAVRAALGAGRQRLVSQFFTESVVLAVAGGAIGTVIAYLAAGWVAPVIPEDLYRVGGAGLDARVLLFTLAVTLAAPIVFGLLPAFSATRADLSQSLREGGRGGLALQSVRARRALVIFEIAMSVVLITGMGLMVRSTFAIQRVDVGFDSDRALIVEVTPPATDYPEEENLEEFFSRTTTTLQGLPGIRLATTSGVLPLNNEAWGISYTRPDQIPGPGNDWPGSLYNPVGPGYFATMRIPLVAGRDFSENDHVDGPPVVAISQTFAEQVWPGQDAVGQTLLLDREEPTTATVVAIVGDVKHEGLEVPYDAMVYVPQKQRSTRRRYIIIGTEGEPRTVVAPVRQALLSLDPNLPVTIRTLRSIVGEKQLQWTLPSMLLGVLGAASLLLATLGIYGVIAYSVAQRRREIGVRMALGATGERIRRGFVGEAMRLGSVGLLIGLVLALIAGQVMASLLFGVQPFDPLTFSGALILFAGVALIASVIPAARASKVNPLNVLRHE